MHTVPLLSKKDRTILLGILLEDANCSSIQEMLELCAFDSVVPCICPTCESIHHYEPDQDRGWCSMCETNSVVSALILAGVI